VLGQADVERLRACLDGEGVVVFPADTVYGLGCDPGSARAVARVYELKRRPPERAAAVMMFALEDALRQLPELDPREVVALRALLPGPLTVLLPNRERRFRLACGSDGATLGLRVPALPASLAALQGLARALFQTSANLSGEPPARTLGAVPKELREGAELVLDGGALPGLASTVLDLREFAAAGSWQILRAGPLGAGELERALASV
jgi:L-threonylcarbamoyladenylate synthase